MTDPFVSIRSNIIIVLQSLFFCKLSQEIYVAMGMLVRCKNIMVGKNDNFFWIPYLCVSTELFFENIKGRWTADIMGKQNVDIQPDAFTGVDKCSVCCFCKNFLGYCLCHWI